MQNRIVFTPQSPKAFLLSSKAKTINGTTTFGGTVDFGGNSVINVGNAGNDFGASNNLVATEFGGNVDGGGNVSEGFLAYEGVNASGVSIQSEKSAGGATGKDINFIVRDVDGGTWDTVLELKGEPTGVSLGTFIKANKRIESVVASGSPILTFFETGDSAAGLTSGTFAFQSGFTGLMECQRGSGGVSVYIPFWVA